jgi:uncharacterized protein (TIGR03000 family)
MCYHPVPRARRRQVRAVVEVLVVAALVGFGLPDSRAEIRNSGARVQVHKDKSDIPRIAAQKQFSPVANPDSVARFTSYSPDNDFYHQYSGAPAAMIPSYSSYDADHRSYYPSRTAERSTPPTSNGTPKGFSPDGLPWNQVGFEDYEEVSLNPTGTKFASPEKYSLEATLLPSGSRSPRSPTALLVAHLPDHALLWIEERPAALKGRTSYFESPPLTAGKRYSYTVRTAWLEDGHWVSQTRTVPVQAGAVQTLYLRPSPALLALRIKKTPKASGK